MQEHYMQTAAPNLVITKQTFHNTIETSPDVRVRGKPVDSNGIAGCILKQAFEELQGSKPDLHLQSNQITQTSSMPKTHQGRESLKHRLY